MAWATYYVRYTIVYSDGQRSTSGTNLNLESALECGWQTDFGRRIPQ
jgi:hypothetical protein